MDEWMVGRMDVALASDRRCGGGPAGRHYYQPVQEKIIQRSALLRSETLSGTVRHFQKQL